MNIDKLEASIQDLIISNIKIFNTELYEAEPLGMVDVGVIEKFAPSSTVDRFAVGMIGYAIEQAIDNVHAESNQQEADVNKAKYPKLPYCLPLWGSFQP